MKNFAERFGPWALVTGASSGIGEAFARRLAELGVKLVLVARREDRLRKLAEELQGRHPIESRVISADLARDDFLPAIQQGTADLQVGLLVNNAGITTAGNFLDNDLGSELALLHVNNRAPLILTHHFGNQMRQRGQGGIIFVSSILAFAGVPTMSNYAATKAETLVFSEGLARELRGSGISVLSVCPGPTQTEFWPTGSNPGAAMQPSAVANIALKKLGRNSLVVPGWSNSLTVNATRVLPRSWSAAIYGWVVAGMLHGATTPAQHPAEKTSQPGRATGPT